MDKMYRCCLLVVVFIASAQVNSLTGLKTPHYVKSNRVTTLKDMREISAHLRGRRAVTLSEVEKKEIVDKHNSLRRLPGASNMEHMVSALWCFFCIIAPFYLSNTVSWQMARNKFPFQIRSRNATRHQELVLSPVECNVVQFVFKHLPVALMSIPYKVGAFQLDILILQDLLAMLMYDRTGMNMRAQRMRDCEDRNEHEDTAYERL